MYLELSIFEQPCITDTEADPTCYTFFWRNRISYALANPIMPAFVQRFVMATALPRGMLPCLPKVAAKSNTPQRCGPVTDPASARGILQTY